MKNIDSLKNLSLFFTLSFLLFLTSCSENNGLFEIKNVDNTNFSASESFTHFVAINNQTKFILEGINGSIKVSITNSPLVTISGIKKVESQNVEDAQNFLSNLKVSFEERSGEIFVMTKQPNETQGRNLTVNYDVSIPKNWITSITNVNGEIIIDSLEADILINQVNGPVALNYIFASVTVDLVNGSIDSKMRLPDQATCTMALVNGSINLNIPQTTSATFAANVTNGSIKLNDLILENTETSNTSISGTLLTGQGSIDLETVNGIINVTGF